MLILINHSTTPDPDPVKTFFLRPINQSINRSTSAMTGSLQQLLTSANSDSGSSSNGGVETILRLMMTTWRLSCPPKRMVAAAALAMRGLTSKSKGVFCPLLRWDEVPTWVLIRFMIHHNYSQSLTEAKLRLRQYDFKESVAKPMVMPMFAQGNATLLANLCTYCNNFKAVGRLSLKLTDYVYVLYTWLRMGLQIGLLTITYYSLLSTVFPLSSHPHRQQVVYTNKRCVGSRDCQPPHGLYTSVWFGSLCFPCPSHGKQPCSWHSWSVNTHGSQS